MPAEAFKTLSDIGKEMTPDMSDVAETVEVLHQSKEYNAGIPWLEGNLPTGNRTNVRTSLPKVYFRRLNEGVPTSKSTQAQLDDAAAMLEGWSEVDEKVLRLSPNPARTRAMEDETFVESMGQQFENTLLYGNVASAPETFNGFMTRFSSGLDGTGYEDSMIDAGGVGSDNMSILVIGWSPKTVTALYPKGLPAGLKIEDHGKVTINKTDANNVERRHVVYQTQYDWDIGLVVKDPRYFVRICNIDYSELIAGTGPDLSKLVIRALERMPDTSYNETYRPMIACSQAVRTMWREQMREGKNMNLNWDSWEGRRVLTFDEVPVYRFDQLTNTEAAVPFS